jgi:hypothetical protein
MFQDRLTQRESFFENESVKNGENGKKRCKTDNKPIENGQQTVENHGDVFCAVLAYAEVNIQRDHRKVVRGSPDPAQSLTEGLLPVSCFDANDVTSHSPGLIAQANYPRKMGQHKPSQPGTGCVNPEHNDSGPSLT